MEVLFQLAEMFMASLGFSLLFHVRKKLLLPAAFGGLITWAAYLLAYSRWPLVFPATAAAATLGAFYAELMARVLKSPSTVFCIPALIPLFPGKGLYQTMDAAVSMNRAMVQYYGGETLAFVTGLAAGMCLAWAFCYMVRRVRGRVR